MSAAPDVKLVKTWVKLVVAAVLVVTVIDGGAAAAASPPAAPRHAKATSGDQYVKVSWAAPSTNGGASVDRYAVQRLNTSTATWSTVTHVSAGTRAWTNSGLTNGTRYYFRVKAHNRIGWSAVSAKVSALPSTVSSAPRYVKVAVGDTTAALIWQAPASTGGAAIDSYRVERSTDGATFGSGVTTTALTATLTGLTPGAEYWFRVEAHNVAGFGPAAGIGPRLAIGVPGYPLVSGTAGDGEVDLQVDSPLPKYSPIDFYQLDGHYPGLGWVVLDYRTAAYAESPGVVWQVTGLTDGEHYYFRVRAHNEAGFGPYTETQTFIPTGPPTAPLGVTGYGTDTGLHVAWDLPASSGGESIDTYEVEFRSSTDATYFETLQTTETSVEQNNAVLGDHYWVTVRAHNINGWGPPSEPALIKAGIIAD